MPTWANPPTRLILKVGVLVICNFKRLATLSPLELPRHGESAYLELAGWTAVDWMPLADIRGKAPGIGGGQYMRHGSKFKGLNLPQILASLCKSIFVGGGFHFWSIPIWDGYGSEQLPRKWGGEHPHMSSFFVLFCFVLLLLLLDCYQDDIKYRVCRGLPLFAQTHKMKLFCSWTA